MTLYYPFPGVCKLFTRDRFPPQPIVLVPSNFTSRCSMNLATRIYFLFCLWRSKYDVGASPMRRSQKYQVFVKNVTQKSHQNDQIFRLVSCHRPFRSFKRITYEITPCHSFSIKIYCFSICVLSTVFLYPKFCKVVG